MRTFHRRTIARSLLCAILFAALALGGLPAGAGEQNTEQNIEQDYKNVARALESGDWGVVLRYRYEHVTSDDFTEDADASTLRTVLWYRSAGFHQLRAYLEFQDVTNLGLADDHNDTQNGVTGRPAIVDPPATTVQQVNLGYTGLQDTEFVLGRREIVLDDARYVGNVLWRQNYQSFDAFYLTQQSIPRTKITYAFVDRVNTVRSTSTAIDSHLLNANVDLKRWGTAVAYYYYLDFEDAPLETFSSASVGFSWQNEAKVGAYRLPYRVELARQNDVADNPERIDATYVRATLGAVRGRWRADLGYELLGGSETDGRFTTPLATLFKFNGWADQFLVTPPNGLRDVSLGAKYSSQRYRAILTLHRFEADSGSAHYGDELDFRFVWVAPWKQEFAVQYAHFDGKDGYVDVDKFWFLTQYTF
jgi:hypothetical protein